ncbi:MAG: hypothetical protein ACTSU5_08140 [Promethearchaeota archaeon]
MKREMIEREKEILDELCGAAEEQVESVLEKYGNLVANDFEDGKLVNLKELLPKLRSVKANMINLLSRLSLGVNETEAYFKRRTPSGPGRIRLIVPRQGRPELDVEFSDLNEFSKVERELGPIDRSFVFPGIQKFFREQYNSEWDDFLKLHPGETIPTLKYENKQVVPIYGQAEELVSKKALERSREAFRPNQLTEILIDTYWDNKGYLKKLLAPKDIDQVEQGLSYTIIELSEAMLRQNAGKVRKIYTTLTDANDEILAKYPEVARLILLNEDNLEKFPGVCERILTNYPDLTSKFPDLKGHLAQFPRFQKFVP